VPCATLVLQNVHKNAKLSGYFCSISNIFCQSFVHFHIQQFEPCYVQILCHLVMGLAIHMDPFSSGNVIDIIKFSRMLTKCLNVKARKHVPAFVFYQMLFTFGLEMIYTANKDMFCKTFHYCLQVLHFSAKSYLIPVLQLRTSVMLGNIG
jgi:hypothetical protein